MAPNGFVRMGNILIQWGTVNYTSNANTTVTYSTPFANVYSVTGTANDVSGGAGGNIPCKLSNITNTTFQVAGTAAFSGDATSKVRWMAIGN